MRVLLGVAGQLSAGEVLYPGGKGVPGGGFAEWDAELLGGDEERAGPERSSVQLAGGPEVVGYEGQQKDIREQRRDQGIVEDERERPAGDRRNHQRNRGDQDESFVG